MRLRTPEGSWFDWLLQYSDSNAPVSNTGTEAPTPVDVEQAIEAMRLGQIEYVTLDADDGTFVQAGGEGETEYQLEHWADGTAVRSTATATISDVRAALLAYLAGERPAGPTPRAEERTSKPARRWFGGR
jgi:hypothetical protein